MTELITVSVSVPGDRVGDLYRFAADLVNGLHKELDGDISEEGGGRVPAPWTLGRTAIRGAYLGGVSDHWRPFLEALAAQPDVWVAWTELVKAIGMTAKQASGMIGAAERRCKGQPPYEKTRDAGEHYFRMPTAAADVIKQLAAEARAQQ